MSSSAPATGAAGAARGTDAPTAEQRHANVVAAILELCKTVADTAARAHAAKMAGRHGDDRLDNFTPEQEQRARKKHYQWMMDQLTHSGALFCEQNMSRATGSTRQELVTMCRTAIEGALQKNEASIVGKRREREEDLQACSVAPGKEARKEALQQGAALQQGPPTMFAAMMSAPDGQITAEAETKCLRAQVKDRIESIRESMRAVGDEIQNMWPDLQAMMMNVDAAQVDGLRYAISTLKNADRGLDEANVSCGTARRVISMAREGMPYAFNAYGTFGPAQREERAGAKKQDTLYADGSELRRTPPLGDE